MENRDPEHRSKAGRLDSRNKIQAKNLSLRNKLPTQKQDNQSLVRESDNSANNSEAKENYSESGYSASTSSRVSSNDVSLTEKNDSLCDFRSPIKDNEMNESLADFNVKPTVLKPNKRPAGKGSKTVLNKKRRNRDTSSNVNQPSIESSFFKPQSTVKTAFLCPLCFKSYKDANAQHNHMKSCAAKNKISTDKLLDAVDLQKKQADERRALGLLAAPPIQPKKAISRKLISEKDPQLQLALALSMSLHEAQVTEEFEEAHLLAGEPCLPINAEMTEERRKTLQNFGFTTNKSVTASTSGKSKKKRPAGPTALQIRTQEERDRLLTVRIAEVLMGDEAITQALLENVEKVMKSEENITLRSRLLRSYHCVKDRLWDKTQQSLTGISPYSCNLVELSPSRVKPETEIKEPQQGTSKLKPPDQAADIPADMIAGSSKSPLIEAESTSKGVTIKNKKAAAVKHKADENSVMNLSKDWRCMLDATYMSDVVIIAKGDIKIHAHQVVFWARCYDILKDMSRNDPDRSLEIQQRILWPEIDALSAEAFLEYVYCGVIERYACIFHQPNILAGVRVLARKYRLKKLFAYLRNKSNEVESEEVEIPEVKTHLEPKVTNDNSSDLSEGEGSISSVETDVNSLSTVCNAPASNESVINERSSDSDNVERNKVKSLNVIEKNNISHNLVVDCFSSSNDSFATMHAKLSSREIGERVPTNAPTGLSSKTDIQSLERSSLSPNRTNCHVDHESDTDVKLINETLEEGRCTSPDIFDDSTISNSAYTYKAPQEGQRNLDHDRNCSDADIEVVSSSCRYLGIQSAESNKKSDMSQESNCTQLDKPFVSTRRKGRSFKPIFAGVGNSNLESANLDQQEEIPRPFLRKKGDITITIERIQRLNAKTASESDSDCESVETIPIRKHKNPFRINVTNTLSMIEDTPKNDPYSGSDNEISSKRRNKLSIFEKKMELEAAKNPARFNLATHEPVTDAYSEKEVSTHGLQSRTSSSELKNLKFDLQVNKEENEDRIEPSQRRSSKPDDTAEAIFDLTQESSRESRLESEEEDSFTNTEDKDLSIFTKYKRKHSHNSIDKYRAAVKNILSQSSVTGIKDTDKASLSDDSLSSNNELWDTDSKIKRKSFSSKYEYTDPDQSTANVQRELSSLSFKGKDKIDNLQESLSSMESDDTAKSAVELEDVELSDLEIDLSDLSKSSNLLGNSRVDRNGQGSLTWKRKSGNRILDDKQELDSLSDVKLDDTEFSIMRNDCGTRKTNISDQETDTECFIESISPLKQPKIADKIKSWSAADGDQLSDIHNEDTDAGEMKDGHYQPRDSLSKAKLDTTLDVVFNKTPESQSFDKDCRAISSPECEISGTFSPPAMNFDFVSGVTNEVDYLLAECKASGKIFYNSEMNRDYCNSDATISPVLASSPRIRTDGLNDINLLNEVSDSEDQYMEFTGHKNSPKTKARKTKSAELEKGGKAMTKKSDEKYYILDSDSSDSESFKVHKTKSSSSISSANRSKAFRKQSTQSRRESITPGKRSRSSLRTLNIKSVSENIIKTKSKSGANFMDDSFDREFARVQTPPIQEPNTSSYNNQTTPQQAPPSANVTPLANYSAMKTPELRHELERYGLKPQKRHRAKQLLRHIYNELHPLVPVGDNNIASYPDESHSEDERPLPKRLNRSNSLEAISNRKSTDDIESDFEILASDLRTVSDSSNDDDGDPENNDLYTLGQSGNIEGFENAFRNLIKVDKRLHNKILAYEPLVLEELHATLKAQGIKCKLNALMDFLDEQCITFRTLGNGKKSSARRKANLKKNQGDQ